MAQYTLTEREGKWFAEGELESGRKIRFECQGATSREAAEAIAGMKWEQRLWASAASKKRWADVRAANGAGASSARPAAPAASATSAERAAEIRAKLISAGDAKPIDDDDGDEDDTVEDDETEEGTGDEGEGAEAKKSESGEYIPPDGKRETNDDNSDDDDEAAELLADVIGNGLYTGVTGGVTKLLKNAKPPREPGEPHELFVKFGREGCCYRMRKLIGKGAKLSPNAKLFIGLAGTIVTMLWNSEVIEDSQAAAGAGKKKPEAAPAAAAAAKPPHANGVAKPPKLALVRTTAAPDSSPEDPLGSFS